MYINIVQKPLYQYDNGNYTVKIYSDGTKIRTSNDNEFIAQFPESIDMKITNYCDKNCPMCHELSTIKGNHASLTHPLIDTIESGTEIAIGGGNPLSHPDLVSFLFRLKTKNIIANITINQEHLFANLNLINNLIYEKLIHGIGVSLTDVNEDLIQFCSINNNAVIHVINGVHDFELLEKLKNKNLKLLILGYKKIGRGESFFTNFVQFKMDTLMHNMKNMFSWFSVLSFDNLAIEQLKIKDLVSTETWKNSYMGDDGCFTMYIDLVKNQFSSSSISNLRMPIKGSVNDMFQTLRNNSHVE